MSEQLAYVVITPYSLYKSRTGGIIARLITRAGLDLVGARMFAPSPELVQQYAEAILAPDDPTDKRVKIWLHDYVLHNFSPDPKTQLRRRIMVLLFKGEDAVDKIKEVVGTITPTRKGGLTIRDTFGDLILDENGEPRYFEPAVFAASNAKRAEANLKLWTRYSEKYGGLLEKTIAYPPDVTPQRTLVLIKPDNFRFPTGRPGNMIEFFSRTGLFIVGIKEHHMSVAQAQEFYAPVREVLRAALSSSAGSRAKALLEEEFELALPGGSDKALGDLIGPVVAENQFQNIVRFMSGRAPKDCNAALASAPGTEKCIAVVYEGVDAVRKIRSVLGPTDPNKAPPGSIRREFGQSIMVNAAHASDSVENAKREIGIIDFQQDTFRAVVEEFYGERTRSAS